MAKDVLRIHAITNCEMPTGIPVRFNGENVGHVIRGGQKGYCELAINSDVVHRLIDTNKCSFSMEVIRK